MTNQELFTKVVTHLLTQNQHAGGTGNCKYRDENGLMCAAGCLIADEYYEPRFEGKRSNGPEVAPALLASGIEEVQLEFVHRLQRIHDMNPVADWRGKLEAMAARHELEFPVL